MSRGTPAYNCRMLRALGLTLFLTPALLDGTNKESPEVRDQIRRLDDDLEAASEMEVLRLHAGPDGPVPEGVTERLHGYPVLARIKVTATDQAEIARQLPLAIPAGEVMLFHCFFPRHAVRAMVEGRPLDLVICFECSMVYVFRKDEEVVVLNINRDVEPLLNRILKRTE